MLNRFSISHACKERTIYTVRSIYNMYKMCIHYIYMMNIYKRVELESRVRLFVIASELMNNICLNQRSKIWSTTMLIIKLNNLLISSYDDTFTY